MVDVKRSLKVDFHHKLSEHHQKKVKNTNHCVNPNKEEARLIGAEIDNSQ